MGGNLGFEDTFKKPEKFRTMRTYYYYCVDKSEKICTSWDRECGGDWSSAPPFLGERDRESEIRVLEWSNGESLNFCTFERFFVFFFFFVSLFRFRVKLTKKLCVSRFGFTYTVVDFSNVFVCLFVLFVFLVITGGGWWSRACLAGWALLERQHLSVFGILRTRGRNLEGFGWLLERDWDNRIFCSDVRNGNKFWVAKSGHKLSFNKCLFQLSWPKKPVLNKTNTKSPFD